MQINRINSDLKKFRYGVPQYIVLGPMLFNLCLYDPFEIKCIGTIHRITDDRVIIYNANTWKEVVNIIVDDL